jgi:Mn-dependent DtxR family transcriptional regulator
MTVASNKYGEKSEMSLQESGEMYLETILTLTEKNGHVRSIDVSEYMGYSKPSVSRAVGILKANGYITVEQDGSLILTESGRAVAMKIYERHKVISSFLTKLGVSAETASADACKIEHVISDETFNIIKDNL